MLWSALVPSLAAFKLAKGTPAAPASPAHGPSSNRPRTAFDIQAHRGGRGDVVENTLPAFAWALINGATTLELDNGITKDGVVIVWHDENIVPEKCKDTLPAFPGDPDFPYVGKLVADLTLDQIKTLDCGTNRLEDYPLQATYPGTRISTLQEFFDFVGCADPTHEILMNIESKIDAEFPNRTKSVDEFVWRQHALFSASAYARAITYQSFDWRTLVGMKARDPAIKVSGLVDDDTLYEPGVPSPWFAGRDVDAYPGTTRGVRLAQMAAALGLDILSPIATSLKSPTREPHEPAYVPFTTEEMIREGHRLGLAVKPWTVNRLNVADRLVMWGVDGLITDYPDATRRWAKGRGMPIAPRYPSSRVLACLAKHNQVATPVLAAAPPPSARARSTEL
ncbi:PLC-like phosphodiesterase [Auricularia subglabra TFB-10046 SS5]|nr:PLC-like phosphodiesterase [Auricularia subglabra TFB-10046 SS5]